MLSVSRRDSDCKLGPSPASLFIATIINGCSSPPPTGEGKNEENPLIGGLMQGKGRGVRALAPQSFVPKIC